MVSPLLVKFSFFFSSRRRHTRFDCDWSSDVCSSDLVLPAIPFMLGIYSIYISLRNSKVMIVTTNDKSFRSEERRVGKECRSRWSRYHSKKKGLNLTDVSLALLISMSGTWQIAR